MLKISPSAFYSNPTYFDGDEESFEKQAKHAQFYLKSYHYYFQNCIFVTKDLRTIAEYETDNIECEYLFLSCVKHQFLNNDCLTLMATGFNKTKSEFIKSSGAPCFVSAAINQKIDFSEMPPSNQKDFIDFWNYEKDLGVTYKFEPNKVYGFTPWLAQFNPKSIFLKGEDEFMIMGVYYSVQDLKQSNLVGTDTDPPKIVFLPITLQTIRTNDPKGLNTLDVVSYLLVPLDENNKVIPRDKYPMSVTTWPRKWEQRA